MNYNIVNEALIEATQKILKAILDLPRFKTVDSEYNALYDSDEIESTEELSKLYGDISLSKVLDILKTESGISKENYEEFIEEYRKNLKGR